MLKSRQPRNQDDQDLFANLEFVYDEWRSRLEQDSISIDWLRGLIRQRKLSDLCNITFSGHSRGEAWLSGHPKVDPIHKYSRSRSYKAY